MKVYQRIAQLLGAIANCERSNNQEWLERHQGQLDIITDMLPSGSGFDSGTTLEQIDNGHGVSTPERLVFHTSYHHMNDGGYYDGWTEHNIIVTPSLQFSYNIRVTGKDRNDIKNYIAETFSEILDRESKV